MRIYDLHLEIRACLVSFYDKKIENELVEVLLRHIRRCKPLLPAFTNELAICTSHHSIE